MGVFILYDTILILFINIPILIIIYHLFVNIVYDFIEFCIFKKDEQV